MINLTFTLKTIFNHRSIRKFKEEPLRKEIIKKIIQAAQMASSSDFGQSYSIIGITDSQIKHQIAQLATQQQVEKNSHLFIFCADLHRVTLVANDEMKKRMAPALESTYFYQVALIDSALAAQNAALAS